MADQNSKGKSLEDLLRENLETSQEILARSKKIQRYMKWRLIMNIVWLILVIAPIILSLFFLPSFLRNFQWMLDVNQSGLDEIMKQLR